MQFFKWIFILGGGGFVLLIMVALIAGPSGTRANHKQSGHTAAVSDVAQKPAPVVSPHKPSMSEMKHDALASVKLNYALRKDAFETLLNANFTVNNGSPYDIKDIEITCEHLAKSGTRIDSNTRTIYDIFPAKKKKTIKNFPMGFIHSQAERSSCRVSDLVVLNQ